MLDEEDQTGMHNRSDDDRIDILIVDDHLLLLETLSAGLTASNEMTVDHVFDVATALERIRGHGRYRVILLDYSLPGIDGLEALRQLDKANDGGVALFSGVAGWGVAKRAIDSGARGFIPKTITFKSLGNAIRFIADGEIYLPSDYVLRTSQSDDLGFGLKQRELSVLSLLSEGHPNKVIGHELGLAETIVKMDVKAICRKLGARNRTQAVIEAKKRGLV